MNDWLRSRARWFGAALIVVLAGGVAYMLRDGGSAHAQADPQGTAQARAIAPVLASAAGRTAGTAVSQSAGSTSHQAGATTARRNGPRPGTPTPPPSRRALSQALREATGLNPAQVTARRVCGAPAPGHATCAAEALVLRTTGALVRPRPGARPAIGRVRSGRAATTAAAASPPDPATPAYLQQAYDLTALSQTGGTGDTVAIVDPFDDPTAESDLGVYRSAYGLPACTSANGCFRKVNQTGGTSSFPPVDSVWDAEISLDLDAVSAICPNCHILLVEANTTSVNDLQTAMQKASSMGANQISDSWSASSPMPGQQHTFSGVATVAATGDNGYVSNGAAYPAAYSGVTAVGGTSLASDSSSIRGFGEQAWFGGGSGCKTGPGFSRPQYQPYIGCSGRVFADLSADADPDTGLKIYTPGGWAIYGGTSLATPVVAAYYAITGVSATTPQWAYTDSGLLNDVVTGSNGSCGTALCNAQVGFDGPTGVGSISGTVTTGAPGVAGPTFTSGTQNTYTQSVGSQGATIGGGIYRNGLDTTWWIEYGTSQTYGAQTTPVDVGAGTAPVAVTGTLTGLTPSTVYHYRLVAKNARGTTYGYDYILTTAPASAPSAAFTASPSAPAPSSPVTFDASGSAAGTSGTITDYSWNFGDGHSDDTHTTPTDSHTYSTRGTYTVTLTITNSRGQTSTSTQTVTVDDPPAAAVTPSTVWTAPATQVTFDASASSAGTDGTISDYSWDFGDGTGLDGGTSDSATHAFASPGVYTVKLTVTDDENVATSTTTVITVDQPNASFTTTPAPATIAPGGTVSFDGTGSTDAENDTIIDYNWNFGDGHSQDTGTTTTASHPYPTRGSYTVALTITNSHGQTNTTTQTVTADNPPTATVAPSTTWTGPASPVLFNASAASGGPIKDYKWDFGDGTVEHTGATASATHAFTSPGVYTVTLTATDDLNVASSPATATITVDQPNASFTAAPAIVAPGGTVSFDGSGSTDPEQDTITDYSWNFGDGSSQDTGTTPTASHPYTARGNYNVTLTITNGHGQTNTTTQTVSADIPPTPAFTVSASSITAGSPVTFDASPSSASSPGSISDYTWDFDGTILDTGSVASTPYTFTSAGPHTVTLTTTDDLGVSAATSQQFTVQAPISATSTPPPGPVTTPTPTPPVSSPPSKGTSSPSLVLRLSVAGRQRLAAVLAHGLRVRLAVNQRIRTSYQISIPLSQTLQGAGQAGNRKATVVLLRGSRNLTTGNHTIFLKLSRAAARRLSAHGPLVLTVRMTLTGANGKTLTRTVKITLTR